MRGNVSRGSWVRHDPQAGASEKYPLQVPDCTRHGQDNRNDNGTPVLNASLHWAALSERQLGLNSREVVSRPPLDDFPGHRASTRGVEDK